MSEKRTPRGPAGRGMPGEKAKDFKGSMAKLIVYMKRYHTPLFFMFLFLFFDGLLWPLFLFGLLWPRLFFVKSGVSSRIMGES